MLGAMDRQRIVIESETAEIARWFGVGPGGLVFLADDGRGLAIRADDAARWKAEGEARVRRFVEGEANDAVIGLAGGAAAFALVLGVAQLVGLPSGHAMGVAVAIGVLAAHLWPMWRLRRFRAELRALRGEIARSLAGAPEGCISHRAGWIVGSISRPRRRT
jgi:hypothetical protein